MKANDPKTALEQFDKFRILCAHREGDYGTKFFNKITDAILRPFTKKNFYKKPVMVNVHAYHKNFFNGDTGLIVKMKDGLSKVFIKKEIERKK